MTIRMLAALIRYFKSFFVSMVGHGQKTAPSLIQAREKIHHSGILVSMTITRSPFLMPYLRSMFAAELERFIICLKVKVFSFPSWFTQIIARRFLSSAASLSMTSNPKL